MTGYWEGFKGQNTRGEEKGAMVRDTNTVGAKGRGYTSGYWELSEGRGVLWGPLPAVDRLYRPIGGLYGSAEELYTSVSILGRPRESAKRAGGLYR